jgi:ABC-type lipoprotein export system ATPase subunit
MNRGVEWARWDLHVHTPASHVHHYGGDSWDKFLTALEGLPPDLAVLGINDYLTVDGYERVQSEHASGRLPNIRLVLPVIELRLSKFAGTKNHWNKVNYHVIFDPKLSPDTIRGQFINGLSTGYHFDNELKYDTWSGIPTPEHLEDLGRKVREAAPDSQKAKHTESNLTLGFNNINFELTNIRKLLNTSSLRHRTITAVGKAEWDSMAWGDASLAEKRDVLQGSDLVFISAATRQTYENAQHKLEEQGVNSKLLDCSDAHYYADSPEKDRLGNCQTWIRAEKSFRGLLHTLEEFEDRVFVGDEPPKLKAVRSNPSSYIDTVQVTCSVDESDTPLYVETEIALNPGFVAVVGNKGNGKSALLDIIGHAANSKSSEHYSFLTKERFRHPRTNPARHHSATLSWRDGGTKTVPLDVDTETSKPERVTYLPQTLLESLCTSDPTGESERFSEELGNVIFRLLPKDSRLGQESLSALVDVRKAALDVRLESLRSSLREINRSIAEFEQLLDPARLTSLRSELSDLHQRLARLDESKPALPGEPSTDDPQTASAREQLESLRVSVIDLETEVAGLQKELAAAKVKANAVGQLRTEVETFSNSHQRFLDRIAADAAIVGIDGTQLVTVNIDLGPLDTADADSQSAIRALSASLNAELEGSRAERLARLRQAAIEAEAHLTEPQRQYDRALERVREYDEGRRRIERGSNTDRGIAQVEADLAHALSLPGKLEDLRAEQLAQTKEIFEVYQEVVEIYEDVYAPAKEFIAMHPLATQARLEFGASLQIEGFESKFWDFIGRNVAGNFFGIDEGGDRLHRLVAELSPNDWDSVTRFLAELQRLLHVDKTGESAESGVARQLRVNQSLVDLYDFLYGLEYLRPTYLLSYGGNAIEQLSPGEKGTLLLMFYLLVDQSDRPLLLDQPDENLDNQTIKNLLVPALKEARARRQVIVVTHNPNVAVVADADQVVVASIDRGSFEYRGAALENRSTIKDVVDILEGTRPAFTNRQRKYETVVDG